MTTAELVHVEEKLAYQEQAVETLSDTVYKQQRRIERLEASVHRLVGQLETLTESLREGSISAQADSVTERPPHY